MILSLLLTVILVVAVFWYVAFVIEYFQNLRPGRVIYHGSNLGEQAVHLERIVSTYIPNTKKYTLIEPGAGLGKVAHFLSKHYSWKEVTAIEVGPVILSLAKLRAKLLSAKVKFLRQDIFTYPFASPSVVYCYLTTEMLEKLYLQGQFKGNLVIALTFPIPNVEPTEKISLASWQKALRVYDFR